MSVSSSPTGDSTKPRVLFFAEAVTLAHVARPIILAKALDTARYDVHLACDPRYLPLFGRLPFKVHPIYSMSSEDFLRALTRVGPIYDRKTLQTYVQEELELISRIDPQLVVGDFRISLGVSTQLKRVPYMVVANAYWSPYAHVRFHMPDVWLAKLLRPSLADASLRLTRSVTFALHAGPLNRVSRQYGLCNISSDLREVFTYGDYVLYADVPELVATSNLPARHRFMGPVLWSPETDLPPWWGEVPADKPILYVTLGSSGARHLLSVVLQALADEDLTVIAASAGPVALPRLPANAFVADYLPGVEAAERADLVVCNGGSPTAHQALAGGAPVLGLAANMDQQLNMDCVQRSGAGCWIRAMSVSPGSVRRKVRELLSRPSYREAAADLQAAFGRYPAQDRFRNLVARVLGSERG